MPSVTMKITGATEAAKELTDLGVDAQRAALAAIYSAAQDIGGRADTLVPEDEGILRGTQHISVPKAGSKKPQVSVRYGGPSADYAIVQHERMDYNHPGGGQAKYLEQPFLEEVSAWPGRFVKRMWAAGLKS